MTTSREKKEYIKRKIQEEIAAEGESIASVFGKMLIELNLIARKIVIKLAYMFETIFLALGDLGDSVGSQPYVRKKQHKKNNYKIVKVPRMPAQFFLIFLSFLSTSLAVIIIIVVEKIKDSFDNIFSGNWDLLIQIINFLFLGVQIGVVIGIIYYLVKFVDEMRTNSFERLRDTADKKFISDLKKTIKP